MKWKPCSALSARQRLRNSWGWAMVQHGVPTKKNQFMATFHIFPLHWPCALDVVDLFWIGLWKKAQMGILGSKFLGVAAGMHSQETYRFIHYFYNFLKKAINNHKYFNFGAQFMHNFWPDRGQTVDKPWKDLPRAWNDISRAWTGYQNVQQSFGYPPTTIGFQSGYSWWHKQSNTYSIKMY